MVSITAFHSTNNTVGATASMSIESLSQLELRLQNLIDKLELSKMEVEDLRSTNAQLESDNSKLKQELSDWGERLNDMICKIDTLSPEEEEDIKEIHKKEVDSVV